MTSVVAGENDQGVVGFTGFFEAFEHPSDSSVEVFNKGDQFCASFGDAVVFFPSQHFGIPIVWRLNGSVRSIVGEVEKKRIVFWSLFGHVIDCPIAENVGGVADGIHFFGAETHVMISVTTMLVIVIHHVAKEAMKVIKSPIRRAIRFIEAEVPFADNAGMIPCFFQLSGK